MKLWLVVPLAVFGCLSASAARVQTCDSGGFSNGTSEPCTFGSAITAGNAIVCAALISGSGNAWMLAMPNESFWNYPASIPIVGGTETEYMGYVLNAHGGVATLSGFFDVAATGDIKCAEYSGLQSLDGSAVGSSGSGTAINGGNIQTNFANDLIVAAGGTAVGTTTFTAGSGYSIAVQRGGGSQSEFFEDKTATVAGSYATDATANKTGAWTVAALAFSTTEKSPGIAVFSNPKTTIVSGTDIGSNQGAARVGSTVFTTACNGGCTQNTQYALTQFAIDANGLPTGAALQTRACGSDAPGAAAITQLTGIAYRADTGHIYVVANNFGVGTQSYVIEYDPTNLAAGPVSSHTLNAHTSEGATWNPVTQTWWVYYFNASFVTEYDTNWAYVRSDGIPVAPPVVTTSTGQNQWQFFLWDASSTIAYGVPHCNNTDKNVWLFYRNPTTNKILFIGKEPYPITGVGAGTCQGGQFSGSSLYLADRNVTVLGGDVAIWPWLPGTLYGNGKSSFQAW